MKSVYLDYNATTPVAKEVKEVISSALEDSWANPSSSYEIGIKAKALIEKSRKQIGKMIGAPESSIVFTSGGTESNNFVIHSAVQYYLKHSNGHFNTMHQTDHVPHVIMCNIEHDSILKPLQHMSSCGLITLSIIPVSKVTGCVDVKSIIEQIRKDTCLITIMLANNETGLIQPVAELGKRIDILNQSKKIPILFHTDAAQAIGKIDVAVDDLKIHFLTIVGHKFYGPRIGAVYAKCMEHGDSLLSPLFFGGGQEYNLRSGTENTPMIVGLGKAAELVSKHLDKYENHMVKMKEYLEKKLHETFGEKIKFNNKREKIPCLPNTVSVSFLFDDIIGSEVLVRCSGLYASTGAACHSSNNSSVLLNSGVSEYNAVRTLRLSVGRETTEDEINLCISKLKTAIYSTCST